MSLHSLRSALVAFSLALASLTAADFSAQFEQLKARATPAQLYAFLYALPKGGDLHNHAGGANLAESTFAICTDPARNGGDTFYTRVHFTGQPDAVAATVRFRTVRRHVYAALSPAVRAEYVALADLTPDERAEWCNAFRLDAAGEGRFEFFQNIWPRQSGIGRNLHVRTEQLVANIKAFAAEGLAYLETQFDVDDSADNSGQPIPRETAVAFVRRRLAQPDVVATGLVVRFQYTVLRFSPRADTELAAAYAFVDAHRDLWVGVNLAGIEENGFGYPARFLVPFRQLRARYPGIALSIHAGEMDGPDRHIRDTLLLGATRIGHGVNLIQDPDTLLLLQQSQRVLVEINLISNRLLEYTPDLAKHPFPEYLRTGVPVCLNTDDRGMWDSNLTDEYYTAVTTFHLSWSEIVQLGRNSLTHAFAQPEVRARLLADYDRAVAAFETTYGAATVEATLARLAAVKPVTYGYAQRTWGLSFEP
ncbi:MAG: adenosine deaminase [Undibacterium sp.]|nr:adenosine deaminase [Opitutaceae bacterium]